MKAVSARQKFSAKVLYHEVGQQRALLADVTNAHGRRVRRSIWIKTGRQFAVLGRVPKELQVTFVARLTGQHTFYYPTQFARLDAVPMKPAPKRCPYCNVRMHGFGDASMTQDHIYPTQWNRIMRLFSQSDETNLRRCCKACNGLRALAGHCVGALACAQQVAYSTRQPVRQIILAWRLHLFNNYLVEQITSLTKQAAE